MYVVLDNCAIISYFVAIFIRRYFPRISIPLIFLYEIFITYEMITRFTIIMFSVYFPICQENVVICVDEASDVVILKS